MFGRDYKTIRIQVDGICDDRAVEEIAAAREELAKSIKEGWDIMWVEKENVWKLYHLVRDRSRSL